MKTTTGVFLDPRKDLLVTLQQSGISKHHIYLLPAHTGKQTNATLNTLLNQYRNNTSKCMPGIQKDPSW